MASKTNFKLGRITLKNYRRYKDTVAIELSRDPEKPITVITGLNGIGKTIMMDAVYWCLYGKFRHSGNYDDMGIINYDVLNSLRLNEEGDTSAEIHIYEDDKLRYSIKRNIHFTKQQESERLVNCDDVDGRIPEGIGITPTVEFRCKPRSSKESDWHVYTDPIQVRDAMLSIFPELLSKYILFDSESPTYFFHDNNKNDVKTTIEQMSGMPVLDYAINHIKKTYVGDPNEIQSPHTDLITAVESILEQCRNDLMDQFRSIASDRINDHFVMLASERGFVKAEMRSDYAISAYKSNEYELVAPLGNVEESVYLGLSYMAAMHYIAEKSYFVIMDSPFGRIDSNARVKIARNLPEMFPDTQIILLCTDPEYIAVRHDYAAEGKTPSVRDTLRNIGKVWKEYILVRSGTGSYNTTLNEMDS